MPERRDEVIVHLDAPDLGPEQKVGILSRERSKSKSVISFAYASKWISAPSSFELDPSLRLFEGEQYQSSLPGIFTDAAPDRWGRTLLEHREALAARRADRKPRELDEWDFLVGVNDETRMGALRLARPGDGAFIDDERLAVPPSTSLRDLEHWARELEEGLPRTTGDEDRWIAMLVAPGSSLGGARPKANFLDDGALWIAKFPSHEDRYDVGAWEYVVTRLAADAGIEIPKTNLLRLRSAYRTFCARRFDRTLDRRHLYASAMTLVSKRDNEDASYLDIAQAIEYFVDPARIQDDLQQLFRRVVFNVLTANRDDHLRNHGFLRSAGGWRLAPAFDINPTPQKLEHALALDGTLRVPNLEIVHDTGPLYRLSVKRADEIIAEVRRAVSQWHSVARQMDLRKEEVESLSAAFEAQGSVDQT
jgi:serine/threonine-protein kinase HipA